MHWFGPEVHVDLLKTQEHNPQELEKINLVELELLLVKRTFRCKVRKKAMIRNRYNRPKTRESDKNTRKHHTQERQDVSPFPAGDHKAARKRQGSIIKTNVKHE